MNIKEERLKWKHDAQRLDRFVDVMIDALNTAGSVEVDQMVIDMGFRGFLHWIHCAQKTRQDPRQTRNSLIHLIDVMIMEAAMRMGSREADGTRVPIDVWVGEFMVDLRDELIIDVKALDEAVGHA